AAEVDDHKEQVRKRIDPEMASEPWQSERKDKRRRFGGALSSLYGLGYGRHEHAPNRVLPFFPAFLAGMNLVIMADD
ncbi:hypothetical protein ACC735_39960, partial [Rhizobium ruizarguesonis]